MRCSNKMKQTLLTSIQKVVCPFFVLFFFFFFLFFRCAKAPLTGCVCRSARRPVTHSTTQTAHLIGQLRLVFPFPLFKLQYLLRSDCQKTRQKWWQQNLAHLGRGDIRRDPYPNQNVIEEKPWRNPTHCTWPNTNSLLSMHDKMETKWSSRC